jgi:hypothetical protein
MPETKTKDRAKKLETLIDGFKVEILFYPTAGKKIIIMVPCSDRPFPIALDSPNQVTSDFTSFVAQIRGAISRRLGDSRARIIPPIHNPLAWRLIHGDLNWDIPTTMLNFLSMPHIQITKVNDIIQRIYAKRIDGKRVIRSEEGVHQFKNAPIDTSIGQTILDAVKEAREQLPSTTVTAATRAARGGAGGGD